MKLARASLALLVLSCSEPRSDGTAATREEAELAADEVIESLRVRFSAENLDLPWERWFLCGRDEWCFGFKVPDYYIDDGRVTAFSATNNRHGGVRLYPCRLDREPKQRVENVARCNDRPDGGTFSYSTLVAEVKVARGSTPR